MKFLYSFILFLSISSIFAARHRNSKKWKSFKAKFKVDFKNEDAEIKSFENFEIHDRKIALHNDEENDYKLGHNEFSTWSKDKLRSLIMSDNFTFVPFNLTKSRDVDPNARISLGPGRMAINIFRYSGNKLPDNFDWQKNGWNTPVRDQLQCGSCYTFASTGSIEGVFYAKTRKNVLLSTQDIKDCSFNYGNNGCHGGVAGYVFEYTTKEGVCFENEYPYSEQERQCSKSRCSQRFKTNGLYLIEQGNDNALREALVTIGPIAVSIDADNLEEMAFYESGIFSTQRKQVCRGSNTNHAVVLVGFGVEGNKKYWRIKNSWGPKKGENGYMRISADSLNNCGISQQAFVPFF